MPEKARYWKNPQKHRKECRDRRQRLVALGIKRLDQFSRAVAERQREYQKNYWHLHRAKGRLAVNRYRMKLKQLFGTLTPHSVWQYSMLNAEKKAKLRKIRAKTAGNLRTRCQ